MNDNEQKPTNEEIDAANREQILKCLMEIARASAVIGKPSNMVESGVEWIMQWGAQIESEAEKRAEALREENRQLREACEGLVALTDSFTPYQKEHPSLQQAKALLAKLQKGEPW